MFRSLIYFELIFLCAIRYRSSFIFIGGYPILSTLFVLETVLSPLSGHGALVENHLTVYARIYSGLYSVLLVYLYVCVYGSTMGFITSNELVTREIYIWTYVYYFH